jgi:hypothetical protein
VYFGAFRNVKAFHIFLGNLTLYYNCFYIFHWTFIKDLTNAEAIANGPSCVFITGIKSLDLCVFLVEEAG